MQIYLIHQRSFCHELRNYAACSVQVSLPADCLRRRQATPLKKAEPSLAVHSGQGRCDTTDLTTSSRMGFLNESGKIRRNSILSVAEKVCEKLGVKLESSRESTGIVQANGTQHQEHQLYLEWSVLV